MTSTERALAMEIPYESFLSSQPFTVQGPNGKIFFVHSTLLAKHSKILGKDVFGGMKEAADGVIKIVDVNGDIDDSTVMRFIEYAYSGSYRAPPPSPLVCKEPDADIVEAIEEPVKEVPEAIPEPPPATDVGEPVPEADDSLDMPVKKSKRKKSKRSTLRDEERTHDWACEQVPAYVAQPSHDVMFCYRASRVSVAEKKEQLWSDFVSKATAKPSPIWEPRRPNEAEGDYTNDLLCHAQLYVFSNRYDCMGLAMLALERLRLALSGYDPTEGVRPVVRLIRYCYSHTHDYGQGRDRLRKLLIDYLVCHLEKVMKDIKFRSLLRNYGPFAEDLLVDSMRRLE